MDMSTQSVQWEEQGRRGGLPRGRTLRPSTCHASLAVHAVTHRTHNASCHHFLPCPQFLSECGWRLRLASDRSQQAAALGLDPELCAFLPANKEGSNGAGKDAKEAASLFMTATPLAAAQ